MPCRITVPSVSCPYNVADTLAPIGNCATGVDIVGLLGVQVGLNLDTRNMLQGGGKVNRKAAIGTVSYEQTIFLPVRHFCITS